MEALGDDMRDIAVNSVRVPRSLKHTFSNRVGLPHVVAGARVPPAFARALSTWLDAGSVLVVSAPGGSGKSVSFANWLHTRPERILWIEGSELPEQGDALDAAFDGLYELGVITQFERMTFTRLQDATDAVKREASPIIMVVNEAELARELPNFAQLVRLGAHWPSVRWAFVTDAAVDADLGSARGVMVVGPADLRDPLAALANLAPTDLRGRADHVRDWAMQLDGSGDMHRLMLLLSQYLSVCKDSPRFDIVDDPDAALTQLLDSRVIHSVDGDDGVRVSLAPEFRDALGDDAAAPAAPESIQFHTDAARDAVAIGDNDATVFHLARSGQHVEALKALANVPVLTLITLGRIDSMRKAAAAIDISDSQHSVEALMMRLQISLVPPLEPDRVRDEIQEALKRAHMSAIKNTSAELDAMVVVSHTAALVARGRYEEARTLGRELAESLLTVPWLELGQFGAAPSLAWIGQATAELLDGHVDVASKFARVAQDSATIGSMPYHLYLATATLAAVEAQRGELVLSEAYLAEAQRVYRRCGWPRSIAQTAEFVARYFLARAALDVDGMSDLRLDISVVPNLSVSLAVLMKICECFVYLHSGHATQTRVAVRQLGHLTRNSRPGALLVALGSEMTFEAMMRAGEPRRAFDYLDAARLSEPRGECVVPLLAAALVASGDGTKVLDITDPCMLYGSHHSPAGHSLLLLVRAAAHELLGDVIAADDTFDEALLTQHSSPMPYLFLMIPVSTRVALWSRMSEQREREWTELRRFLATVPETVGQPDESLPHERLTAREMEILRALALGGTLNEIAESQFVSRNTVKTHVRVLYRKLRVSSRVEAAAVMKRFGQQLLDSPLRASLPPTLTGEPHPLVD